jgi:glucose-6-phosphate 1-epimerase
MSEPQTIAALHGAHSLPGRASWIDGGGGLAALEIKTAACTARVYAHGAHIALWQPAAASAPVLFMSPRSAFQAGKAIRGGVPVCYPWFGPKHDDPKAPAHGFARSRAWRVESVAAEGADVLVTLFLRADDDTRRTWPHEFEVRHIVRLGTALTMTLETRNLGAAPFALEEALHTYLAVSDVAACRLEGLAGASYIDKVEAMKVARAPDGPLVLSGETDRIFTDTTAAVVLDDPGLRRRIRVEKTGSTSTVVWNPWAAKAAAMSDLGADAWRGFVCVEACNVRPAPVTVAPGGTHTMSSRIVLE